MRLIPDDTDGPSGASDNAEQIMAAMEEFERRIPMKPQMRRLQAHIATYTETLFDSSTRERRHPIILAKIQDLQARILRNDPVYVSAMQHLETLLDEEEGSEFTPASSAVSGASSRTRQQYENQINRRGDILLVEYASIGPFAWIYSKDWDHTGLYYGSGDVYDSDLDGSCRGVDVRSLRKFIRERNEVQFAQLADSDGRRYASSALNSAENLYGDDCDTPYNYRVWDKGTDSSMYCSQLVWKTYLNHLPSDYRVDLNSNNWSYLYWLTVRYGSRVLVFRGLGGVATSGTTAYIIGNLAVAPDEVARDSDLNYYFRERVNLR